MACPTCGILGHRVCDVGAPPAVDPPATAQNPPCPLGSVELRLRVPGVHETPQSAEVWGPIRAVGPTAWGVAAVRWVLLRAAGPGGAVPGAHETPRDAEVRCQGARGWVLVAFRVRVEGCSTWFRGVAVRSRVAGLRRWPRGLPPSGSARVVPRCVSHVRETPCGAEVQGPGGATGEGRGVSCT